MVKTIGRILGASWLLLRCTQKATATTTNKNYTFALAPKLIDHPFFDIARDGCVDAAQRLGVTCLYIGPTSVDAEEQARILLDYIRTQSIDGLAVSVTDEESITPVISEAMDHNIPVVTFDSDAPDSRRIAYIGTDNYFFGNQLGKVLKQLVPQGGTYAVVSVNHPNIRERERGLRDSLLDEGSWTEVAKSPSDMNDNATLATEQMEDFARESHPTAIVPCMGAPMRSDGWKDFVNQYPDMTLVVADASPNQLELLNRNFAKGLVGQLPYDMGRLSIETLLQLVQVEELEQDFVGTNVLEHVNIPLILPELYVDDNLIGNLWYVGFILFGIILITAIGFGAWMWRNRNVRVVKVAQPMFLIMVALGVLVMGSALIPLSFDDSNAKDDATVACMSTPWLLFLGFTVTFSALFAKTWRVNRIFHSKQRFERVTVTASQVLIPFVILLTANVIVLTCWTVLDPLTYVRENHVGTDGWNRVVSTYGSCQSENAIPYLVPLAVMNVGVLAIANWQAYEARMIKSEFSESKYIGIAMASMLQAGLTGIPLLFIVRENPQAYYLILTFTVFVISMAILLVIFVPKMVFADTYKGHSPAEQSRLISRSIRLSQEARQARSSVGVSLRSRESLRSSTASASKQRSFAEGYSGRSSVSFGVQDNIQEAIAELEEEGILSETQQDYREQATSESLANASVEPTAADGCSEDSSKCEGQKDGMRCVAPTEKEEDKKDIDA